MGAVLPDELWRRILEIGIVESSPKLLNYKDLCSLSICSKPLYHLSNDDVLWSYLLSSDFSQSQLQHSSSSSDSSPKSLYKLWFERDKARKLLAHRRAVLRVESRIAEHSRRLSEIKHLLVAETEKMRITLLELSNLQNVRQASVALNVWQPEVVRGRQKQIVEQCGVNVDSRISALDMELKLCKQQIAGFEKSHRDEKSRLHAAKEELASVRYHPLRDYTSRSSNIDEHSINRKKLKKSVCKVISRLSHLKNAKESGKQVERLSSDK